MSCLDRLCFIVIADFLNAPTVEEVDLSAYGGQSGDEIVVMADDDGCDSEAGAAAETPPESGRWVYVTSADVL